MSDSEDEVIIRRPAESIAASRPQRTISKQQQQQSTQTTDDDGSSNEQSDGDGDDDEDGDDSFVDENTESNYSSDDSSDDDNSDSGSDSENNSSDSESEIEQPKKRQKPSPAVKKAPVSRVTKTKTTMGDDDDNGDDNDDDLFDNSDVETVKPLPKPRAKRSTTKKEPELDEDGNPIIKPKATRKPKEVQLDEDGNPIVKPKATRKPKEPKEPKETKPKVTKLSAWEQFEQFDDDDFDFSKYKSTSSTTTTTTTTATASITSLGKKPTSTPTTISLDDDSDGDLEILSTSKTTTTKTTTTSSTTVKPTISAATTTPNKQPIMKKVSRREQYDMFDDDDFDLTPQKPKQAEAIVDKSPVKSPVKSAKVVISDDDDDDDFIEFKNKASTAETKIVQLPPPQPMSELMKETVKEKSKIQQQLEQQSSQSDIETSTMNNGTSQSSQTTAKKPTKASAYLDDDEDETEIIQTDKSGQAINIFASMMLKRKNPPTSTTSTTKSILTSTDDNEVVVQKRVVASAPNRSVFDFSDEEEYVPKTTKSTPKSTSAKPTPTKQTLIKSTKSTTTTTTTTTMNDDDGDDDEASFDFKKQSTKQSITMTDNNITNVDDSINAWGEEHFIPTAVSWKPGQQIPYAAITSMFAKCESTSKRLLIISYVRDFFRAVILNSPEQLLQSVYMAVNQVAPAFEGTELGIGPSILERVVYETVGISNQSLKEKLAVVGDLGTIAQSLKSNQTTLVKPKALMCNHIFDTFRTIAKTSGKSSQDTKRNLIKGLLANSQGDETRFLIRAFQGNLRIHLALQSVLRALAEAIVLTPPKYKQYDENDINNDGDLDDFDNDVDDDDDGDDDEGDDDEGDNDDDDDIVLNGETDGRKIGSKKKAAKDAKKSKANNKKNDDSDDEMDGFEASKNATPLQRRMQWATKVIESAYNEGPSFERLVPVLLEYPLSKLKNHCMLTPGIPIKVMLGKPGKSVDFAVEKLLPQYAVKKTSNSNDVKNKKNSKFFLRDDDDEDDGDVITQQSQKSQTTTTTTTLSNIPEKPLLAWEYKYDGERAQIHKLEDGSVQIFSRHMEPYTAKYPDVIANLPLVQLPQTKTFIIDCEIVAWDVKQGKILPFQVLSTRKRKDVDASNVSIQVQLFPFDMLYYNGVSLMKTEFIKRRELLHSAFQEVEGKLKFATYVDGQDQTTISNFLPQAISDSCEGLMAKPLYGPDSYYVPDKRKWIKLKKDYLEGVGDTIDLVILAAWYGQGKRTGVYGTFLYFSYDRNNAQYQSMTRIGTGYSDKDLSELHATLQDYKIDEPQNDYHFIPDKSNPPDQWFAPHLVAEVKCADLTLSPEYVTAQGLIPTDDGSEPGIGMRFPRFLRLRPDKPTTAATSPKQIKDLYFQQSGVQKY